MSELFDLLRKRAPAPETKTLAKAEGAKPVVEAKPADKPLAKAAVKPAAKPVAKPVVKADAPKPGAKPLKKQSALYTQEDLQKIADGIAKMPNERDRVAALIMFGSNVQDHVRLAKSGEFAIEVGPGVMYGAADSGPDSMDATDGAEDGSQQASHVEGNVTEGGEDDEEESENAGGDAVASLGGDQPGFAEADGGPKSMSDKSGVDSPDVMSEVTEAGKADGADTLKKAKPAAKKPLAKTAPSRDFKSFVHSFTQDLNKVLGGDAAE